MEQKSRKQDLIQANKYRLSCMKFIDECKQYGIEISSEEVMDFTEGMSLFLSLPQQNSEELRFELSEIDGAFDSVMQRLNLRADDTITVFVGDCVLLGGEHIFPACLKIQLDKALEYFRRKTNDTIGAEILLVSEHCAVGLLDESDEWDNEKIFLTTKLF